MMTNREQFDRETKRLCSIITASHYTREDMQTDVQIRAAAEAWSAAVVRQTELLGMPPERLSRLETVGDIVSFEVTLEQAAALYRLRCAERAGEAE